MAERKLATLRRIAEVHPIANADAIERAVVDGWNVVVKKGEFRPGDQCVYFEIDSMLPVEDARFGFLAPRGVTKGPDDQPMHRLRTAKLRGVVSQGLALSARDFPELDSREVSEDLTAALGIVKYEPTLPGGDMIGPFPTHLAAKTDAERVQNLTLEWPKLRPLAWTATEKIDGTSMTVAWDNVTRELIVAGRNWRIAEGDNLYWDAVERYALDTLVKDYASQGRHGAALQVEVYGSGVQGNPLALPERRVAVFTLWVDRQRVAVPTTFVPYRVPILDIPLPATVAEAVVAADGLKSTLNPNRLAEGIVWHAPDQEPIKAVNNKYLLKHDG